MTINKATKLKAALRKGKMLAPCTGSSHGRNTHLAYISCPWGSACIWLKQRNNLKSENNLQKRRFPFENIKALSKTTKKSVLRLEHTQRHKHQWRKRSLKVELSNVQTSRFLTWTSEWSEVTKEKWRKRRQFGFAESLPWQSCQIEDSEV